MDHLVRNYALKYKFSKLMFFFVDEDSHLRYLMVALEPVVQWFNLGVYLGVKTATLEKIKIEERERVEDCKREMLIAWLRSSEEPCTKQQLESALMKISHQQ